MSVTMHISCEKCDESFWIGQKDYIYRDDKRCMSTLERFLFKHMGHNLKFGPRKD